MCYNQGAMMNWGLIIKRLREQKGLTQAELSELAGVERSHLSRIETGAYQSFKEDTIKGLARGLGISLAELSQEIYGPAPQPISGSKVELQMVPVYADFAFHAGESTEPVEHVYRAMMKGNRKKHLEGYIVHGTCLMPDVLDGDTIIVDRERAIENGDIVACQIDGELYIARLKKVAHELWLENNHDRHKFTECQVCAVVIEVVRRLK
jgi:transcriptional regulator with XRE-family HTH domain